VALSRSALIELLGDRTLADSSSATLVVIPSVTTAAAELERTPGAEQLEERLMFTLLLLRDPGVRIVYVTALQVDEAIVDYYLRYVPDGARARERLEMVALDQPGARALTHKLLERPDAVERVRGSVHDPDRAYVLCYKVTPAEHALAAALRLPLEGPDVAQLGFDSKTASRRLAREHGVPLLDGEEGLESVAEVEEALRRMSARRPRAAAAIVKLNDAFAGRGNATVRLARPLRPLGTDSVELVAADETWEGYAAKIERGGAVVEEFLDRPGLVSSCAQMRIAPTGAVQVVSVYDMQLTGERRQVYSGCRYPAGDGHRALVRDEAVRVARALAGHGVFGWFGVDFVVDRSTGVPECYLSEINLRMGGGTHPFWMALLACGGDYDPASGDMRVDGRLKSYVATDDVQSAHVAGQTPGAVIDLIDRAGLSFDRARGHGVTLQFLGAVRPLGMFGLSCIADTPDEAEALRREAVAAVARSAPGVGVDA
jgi:hypothetical protein